MFFKKTYAYNEMVLICLGYLLSVRITFISEFYLYLTGLSDAQTAGTTLVLGVSVKVSLAEISI